MHCFDSLCCLAHTLTVCARAGPRIIVLFASMFATVLTLGSNRAKKGKRHRVAARHIRQRDAPRRFGSDSKGQEAPEGQKESEVTEIKVDDALTGPGRPPVQIMLWSKGRHCLCARPAILSFDVQAWHAIVHCDNLCQNMASAAIWACRRRMLAHGLHTHV